MSTAPGTAPFSTSSMHRFTKRHWTCAGMFGCAGMQSEQVPVCSLSCSPGPVPFSLRVTPPASSHAKLASAWQGPPGPAHDGQASPLSAGGVPPPHLPAHLCPVVRIEQDVVALPAVAQLQPVVLQQAYVRGGGGWWGGAGQAEAALSSAQGRRGSARWMRWRAAAAAGRFPDT